MTLSGIVEEFRWRGLLAQTSEGAEEALSAGPVTAYIGFDPTAPSLHLGSLLPIMSLVHLQRHGHTPIAVVGGGTGLIGDPSGKRQERPLLTPEEAQKNLAGIRSQLARFLDFSNKRNPARIVDNAEWLAPLSAIALLRDVGKHFPLSTMLTKESVRRRLDSNEGLSFTEFAYALLQAYDFAVLFDRFGCTFQLGGSDQWGNIVAGIELVRRARGERVYGLVHPLVTTTTGAKFGKTEAGTIWLSAERTSPYRLFQFFLNTDDADVIQMLQYFTLLGEKEVRAIAADTASDPAARRAQRVLAREVTRLIHGESGLMAAERATSVLFGGDASQLSAGELRSVFEDVPTLRLTASEADGDGLPLAKLLVRAGLSASVAEARHLINGGGAYVNNRRIGDVDARMSRRDAIGGEIIVLRKGSKTYALLLLTYQEAF